MGKIMNWLLSGNSGTNSSNDFVGTTDNQPLVIKTKNTEQMRIDVAGNVGIGVAAPTRKLEIAATGGNILWAGASTGSMANIDLSGHVQLREFSNGGIAYLQARDDSSNRSIALRIRTQKAGTATPSIIEAATIDANGNVGIGHPTPDRNLTVYRSGATTGVYANVKNDAHEILVGVDGAAIVSAMTNSDLQIRTNNTPRMVITAGNGNVGIGQASPKDRLHLSGQGGVRCRINSDNNSGVALTLKEQPQWSVATVLVQELAPPIIGPGPRGPITPPSPVRGNFQIYNDRVGQNALYIDGASLNVGIGTTEPTIGTLQVNGNIASARASDGTNAGFFDWYNLSNNKRWHMTMRSGDGDKLQLYHNDGGSWSGAHLNINPDGNVGIGTSSPGAKLEVNGDVKVSGDILLTNADFAEDFDIVAADKVEPGTVMVIDQEGALRQSHQAYDKRVAGVTSGAGDYKPGIILDKQQSGDNRMPIALVGKVYCKVDAQYSPIEVGDLLTTSATPGHAMKVENTLKAFGAVIGKALRPLKDGQGLIPILIALQ